MSENSLDVVCKGAQPNLSPNRTAIKSDSSLHSGRFSLNQNCVRGKTARDKQRRLVNSSPSNEYQFRAKNCLRLLYTWFGRFPFICQPIVIFRKESRAKAYFGYNFVLDYGSPLSHAIAAPRGFCRSFGRNRASCDRCCLVARRQSRLRGRLPDLLPRSPHQRPPWGLSRCAGRAGACCVGSSGRKASFLRRLFRRYSAVSSSARFGINQRPGQPGFRSDPFLFLPTR